MGSRPLMDIPLKADYIRTEAAHYCRRHQVVLGRPLDRAPMHPLPVARAFNWIAGQSQALGQAFASAAYRTHWEFDRPLDQGKEIRAAGLQAGVPPELLGEAVSDPRTAASLRESVDGAIARGVFGSPFFLVDGEPFFGVDKIELMEKWLSGGG